MGALDRPFCGAHSPRRPTRCVPASLVWSADDHHPPEGRLLATRVSLTPRGFPAGPRVSLNFGFGPPPRPRAPYVPRSVWMYLPRTPAAPVSVRQKSAHWNSPARARTPHSNASSPQPKLAGAIIVLMYSISRCRASGYVNGFVILSSFLRRHSFQVVILRALGPALLYHR